MWLVAQNEFDKYSADKVEDALSCFLKKGRRFDGLFWCPLHPFLAASFIYFMVRTLLPVLLFGAHAVHGWYFVWIISSQSQDVLDMTYRESFLCNLIDPLSAIAFSAKETLLFS